VKAKGLATTLGDGVPRAQFALNAMNPDALCIHLFFNGPVLEPGRSMGDL